MSICRVADLGEPPHVRPQDRDVLGARLDADDPGLGSEGVVVPGEHPDVGPDVDDGLDRRGRGAGGGCAQLRWCVPDGCLGRGSPRHDVDHTGRVVRDAPYRAADGLEGSDEGGHGSTGLTHDTRHKG